MRDTSLCTAWVVGSNPISHPTANFMVTVAQWLEQRELFSLVALSKCSVRLMARISESQSEDGGAAPPRNAIVKT